MGFPIRSAAQGRNYWFQCFEFFLFCVSQITNLVEQLEQFREELENKNEEVQQLHMQLEIQRKESATRLQELEQEIKVLKVSSFHSPI